MKTLKTLPIVLTIFFAHVGFAQEMESKDDSESTSMKTYLIEREIPGAGALTQADLQGASQKSCEVLKEMDAGIEWINSYVVDDKLYCVYRAENPALIREHAEKGGFPCNNIMEIRAKIDPSTAQQ